MHKRLMAMKQSLAAAIESQLCNLGEADAEELGQAIDMLKDLEEALYFCTITEAMNSEKSRGNIEIEYEGHKKNGHSQMNESDHMYYSYPIMYNDGGQTSNGGNGGRSYNDGGGSSYMYAQPRDSQGRYMSDGREGSRNNYYTEPMYERDEREGRSPQNRRMYMEAKGTKDKAAQLRELEKYMQELTSDMVEMIQDSSPEEKQYLEKKISALASKIGQMK